MLQSMIRFMYQDPYGTVISGVVHTWTFIKLNSKKRTNESPLTLIL